MDAWHRFTNWLDHYRWTVAGVALAAFVTACVAGCPARTASLSDPGARVTSQEFERQVTTRAAGFVVDRVELEAQVAKLNARIQAENALVAQGRADIVRQEELRAQAIETVAGLLQTVVAGGAVSWQGILASAIPLVLAGFGVGATLDSRRKDKVIASLSVSQPPPS